MADQDPEPPVPSPTDDDRTSNTLAWDELTDTANNIYRIWSGQPELLWAEKSWKLVVADGSADYKTPIERLRAYARFLALGGIFNDFCRLAFEEGYEPDYWSWLGSDAYADKATIAFRLGQVIGEADGDWNLVDSDYDSQWSVVLKTVVDEERATVYRILDEGFGGTTGLFVALWRSKDFPIRSSNSSADDQNGSGATASGDPFDEYLRALDSAEREEPEGDDNDEPYWETDDEILNADVTWEKVTAYDGSKPAVRPTTTYCRTIEVDEALSPIPDRRHCLVVVEVWHEHGAGDGVGCGHVRGGRARRTGYKLGDVNQATDLTSFRAQPISTRPIPKP